MPKFCCVPNCHSSSDRDKNVSFFSFPLSNKTQKKEWIFHIKRDPGPNFNLNIHTRVCSKHFTPADIQEKKGKRVLVNGAVPSIFSFYNCSSDSETLTLEKYEKLK